MVIYKRLINTIFLCFLCLTGFVQFHAQTFALNVERGEMVYNTDPKENQILDFSYAGYNRSERPIPDLNNVVFVSLAEGDHSHRIQKAIDHVSSLPADKSGYRGAVLLDKGTFVLEKSLRISASGVVLRGMDREETILFKKGTHREAVVYVEGENKLQTNDDTLFISEYVPAGSLTLPVAPDGRFSAGERVIVVRPSVNKWIQKIGCSAFGGGIGALGWKPGDADIVWDRMVTEVSAGKVTLDAPLTTALDPAYGSGYIISYSWPERISESGVEHLTIVSDYNKTNPKDEDHAWDGIYINNAENCWVRQVNFYNLAGSAVILQPGVAKVTVQDCIARNPVSEHGGWRRRVFHTMGQLTLFERCFSEQGMHDFSAGYCAAGPNAFVQCESKESLGFSGSIDIWSPGLLFDIVNIDGHDLVFKNLGQDKNGAGWNTGNSMFWQCTAAEIHCYSPTNDAVNRAYGCWAQFSGDGEWMNSNNHINPRSLFYAQLQARLGEEVADRAGILEVNTNATTSPSVEEALEQAKAAFTPRITLSRWIMEQPFTAPVSAQGIKSIDQIKIKSQPVNTSSRVYSLENGVWQADGKLIAGHSLSVRWWSGKVRKTAVKAAAPHITRFVPGREGYGLTDRINEVVEILADNGIAIVDHNYGLWYDRRRDDHERIRRRDGDAWAPFYEQPFARSGEGKAWDGLSRYDLTSPNRWYWSRMQEYAAKAATQGMVLLHQNYFQHNILEAGAHWVDSPWRDVNNINSPGFPEPVPFAGDKRIFIADMFYDIEDPVKRDLHRGYIRQCLEAFADHPNVVQMISEEYTGPLHFVEFWLDVIAEWKQETGKPAIVALSTTKDVQDAILTDPVRSKVVDMIDIKYWHYRNDGTAYAPEGGLSMAPRQFARKMKIGTVGFEEVYRAVAEYREKYPDKAVTYFSQKHSDLGWAVLMAGGSLPALPIKDESFLKAAAAMKIEKTDIPDCKKLVKSDISAIIFSRSGNEIPLQMATGKYSVKYVDPYSGETSLIYKSLKINSLYVLKIPAEKPGIYWIEKM